MYTSSKPDHTQVHILPCTCTGVCEGRMLAVDRARKETYCWSGTQISCNQLYSNKARPPKPCVWNAKTRVCLRNDNVVCLACPKCGAIAGSTNRDGAGLAVTGSCCAPGGAWYGRCGNGGEAEFSWSHGIKACEGKNAIYSFIYYCVSVVSHRFSG